VALTQEERVMLEHSAARFIAQRYGPARRMHLASTDEGFGREEWSVYAEMGWLAVALPVTHGGAGGSAVDLMIIMEAVGRGLLMEPIMGSVVLGAGLIERAGTPSQREQLLPAIAGGKLIVAFAHTEPDSGYCREWMATTARTDQGDGYCLTGRKLAVMHGNFADQLLVSAKIDGDSGPVGLFLIGRGTPRVAITSTQGIDDRPLATIDLDRALISRQQRLGCADSLDAIENVLDRATLCVCAEALGAIQICNSMVVEHLKTRRQFGATLSTFQALRHRVADMVIAETQVRSMVRTAAEAIDRYAPNAAQMVSAAKVTMGRAARFVGQQTVQLHGAIGMTDELAVGHYFKRLLSLESVFGDAEWHLQRLGSMANIYAEASAN